MILPVSPWFQDLYKARISKGSETNRGHAFMPSLLRFLAVVGVIGGLIYGGIFALANFVKPTPREMTVTVPPDKFLKR